uniref:33 kDa inner dynein arm light chain, axonemal n=1 Tax=Lygus hesperus TaxID=30085 RepID=A0A0A9WKR8_LYGHE
MERLLEEESIVRYTAPFKIRDKDGNYVPSDRRIPTEISCKIERGDISFEESKKLLDILNCVLPPREWEEQGELWMQQVSPEPVTRDDVIRLTLLVDRRLKALKALDSGIDPVRRHVYSQLMDELIRQEVVINPERGILLLKVRDELKMTLEADKALFENGKQYGSTKAAEAELHQESLVSRCNRHLKERDAILAEVNSLRAVYKQSKKLTVESLLRFDKVCIEELRNLNEISTALKIQLRDIFSGMN